MSKVNTSVPLVLPVFHVGFPKAGSTTLQRQVFPHLNGYTYYGMHRYADKKDDDRVTYTKLKEFYDLLFKCDSVNFDAVKTHSILEWLSNKAVNTMPLFSHEAGLGTIYSYPDVAVKAERLFKVFGPDLRVVIIVREQSAILASQYRDHPFDPRDIIKGKPMSFPEWIDAMDRLRYFRFTDLLHYDRIAAVYDSFFSRKNVLVQPLELMTKEPHTFARTLGEFLDVDYKEIEPHLGHKPMNEGHSAGLNRLRRWRRYIPENVRFSKFLPKPLYGFLWDSIVRGPKENVEITPALKKYIKKRYAQSNKALSKRIQCDLGVFDYCMTDELEH